MHASDGKQINNRIKISHVFFSFYVFQFERITFILHIIYSSLFMVYRHTCVSVSVYVYLLAIEEMYLQFFDEIEY